jgi:hypothetical protein
MEVPLRVSVFSNTERQLKKMILVHTGDHISEVLSKASKALWNSADGSKIFFPSGIEVDDVQFLRENDIVYISKGESFEGKFYLHPYLLIQK